MWLFLYQSHHTGIEMTQPVQDFAPPAAYQSHHTGIEMKNQIKSCQSVKPLSIAPYWN